VRQANEALFVPLLVLGPASPASEDFPDFPQQHFFAGPIALYRMADELQDISAKKEGYRRISVPQNQENRRHDKASRDTRYMQPKADRV
jgi:hypothetical protein